MVGYAIAHYPFRKYCFHWNPDVGLPSTTSTLTPPPPPDRRTQSNRRGKWGHHGVRALNRWEAKWNERDDIEKHEQTHTHTSRTLLPLPTIGSMDVEGDEGGSALHLLLLDLMRSVDGPGMSERVLCSCWQITPPTWIGPHNQSR